MSIVKGVGDFFGLDIGTTAVRAVQLQPIGANKWDLKHYGYVPLDIKTGATETADSRRLIGEAITTAIGQSGIRTRDVAISLPAQKTFVTVIDVPKLSDAELKATIKYQIDQYIPVAVDEAQIDWKILGPSLHDPSQQEVLLASTNAPYAEERVNFIEDLGLNVIAAEPDALAMIRSVLPANARDMQMIVDIGESSTNVAITYGDAPRLVRVVPMGLSSLVKAAMQNLNVQEDQARQFIVKFGLDQTRLEGQVVGAIATALDSFAAELTKSVTFLQSRYQSVNITQILLAGYASVIPRLGEYISSRTNLAAVNADPWHSVHVGSADGQLKAVASEFAVAIGLAQRRNDA